MSPVEPFKMGAVLLNSGGGWTKEESVILMECPSTTLSFQGEASVLRSGKKLVKVQGSPLPLLEEKLRQGYFAVGYISYEFFWSILQGFRTSRMKDGLRPPVANFMFFEKDAILREKLERWLELTETPKARHGRPPRPNMTKPAFAKMVEKARRYIARGDIYQVNLSQRFDTPFKIQPEQFLSKLYRAQPTPYSCCLDFGEFQLLSGSMELFLRKTGRKIVTKPIKGTRRRGKNTLEDAKLRGELLKSEKERAENLMIVDLMRNDLSRVCEAGSVRVNRLFEVEPYTTLYQLVSEVEGKLEEKTTINDIFEATFPPGSVTGAPKVRAMEIIDELEPHFRGPYCGAIGFFKPDGDFTLSVAIRVLLASHGVGTFWVGGGITWGSVPGQEYEETLVKARAMMKALP
ncbi:MAG: aminodeoxychorismate synthase component I [Candidatus Hadarchaeota archaeon]